MSKLDVVVGGQFGSEAKGAVCARLVRKSIRDGQYPGNIHVIRVAGHNAGHTAYDGEGRPWALRTVPAAMVVDPDVRGYIAAGSEVNPDVLTKEVNELEAAGIPIRARLFVDEAATWLEDKHIEAEGGLKMHERTGSTAKGVGAARADRIMRVARTIGEWEGLPGVAVPVRDTARFFNNALIHSDGHLLLEGTQGYGLGVHTEHYPLTTSSSCRAIDFLAMAGIDPTLAGVYKVWVVLRRYPIRVAGPSGELKDETSWEALGLPQERTTVTKKVRRVGEWDPALAEAAVAANGGPRNVRIAYTMADQQHEALKGLDGHVSQFIGQPEIIDALAEESNRVHLATGLRPTLYGTGPNSMIETF